ncbi:M14-type cytosolic carboxypeptidase [Rhodopirellula sp. JC740]|uniref:M14-type cytosolic carboxypeptidase n=1 Tax=Rhodopirellula halodulae TaxID=2894198 RepID=A0ABS8NFD7_9BACT|nr:M14-type cytosolic carboxypeptidase [Rhodopirellula sp. JC740]MCC9642272.1 M14-type cytosolic carboxypeptidase [Rhodopirellula sp. JC740]
MRFVFSLSRWETLSYALLLSRNASLVIVFTIVGASFVFADPSAEITPTLKFLSQDKEVSFETDFAGGKIDELVEYSGDDFEILIRPENEPINDSAWYAFRVSSTNPRHIKVRLRYEGGSHRYEPKISRDRVNWEPAEHLIVARHPGGREVTLRLPVSNQMLWVAGQELVGNKDIANWVDTLAKLPFVESSVAGHSVMERPIHRLAIGNPDTRDVVYALSRQHPPEVTGTIGMMHFIEALCGDSELAKRYRQEFLTVAIPIANPDGVAKGYWRSNANGVDLNRDWLQFKEPETRAIHNDIVSLRGEQNKRMWLFLDFHSTYNEVFYTVPKKTKLFPEGFTADWLQSMNNRLGESTMIRDDGHNAHRSTSKAWVAREIGIHAVTYEFGDETDRERIRNIAVGSAEEMMKLLLARKANLD